MPSFAFHPINCITRSISSPTAIASPHQAKVVSVVTATRSRHGNVSSPADLTVDQHSHLAPSLDTHPHRRSSQSSDSFTTATSDQHQHSPPQPRPDSGAMPRLNPLYFISAITPSSPSHHHLESNKPPSPVSSSGVSSARDSLPMPSSFSRSSSYNGPAPAHHQPHKLHPSGPFIRAVTDLPPVSPMSSMYDPHSPEVSADGSRVSDDGSGASARLSSSSASDSLDGNVFLRPRSTRDNRLRSNEVRGPVVNGNGLSRPQSRDVGPSIGIRRTLLERPSSPNPSANAAAFPLHSRESALAGIAARGKVVDAFVANRQVSEITKPDEVSHFAQGMPRVMSGKSLEIPRGKVEQLPAPRPVTPCQVPRPETPSRLPRPRVFIKPSPSRHSVVDPVAVTQDSEMGTGEAEFVTREIPRPISPYHIVARGTMEAPSSSAKVHSLQEEFYFSDVEHVEDHPSEYRLGGYTTGAPTPSDMLTYKVRRAVSALRSISFQAHNPDDIETAWGQANAPDPTRERNNASAASSRWRRACGRISSKNGVQEYEYQSEADAHSTCSYNSNFSTQRDRGVGSRELRGAIGVPLRGDQGSRQRRSLWTNGKKDRPQAPQTRAAELLLANGRGLLAASSDTCDNSNALTTISPDEAMEMSDRARNNARRCSVDKYVEFIHASAQRETRTRNQYRTLRSRIVNRMFRRR